MAKDNNCLELVADEAKESADSSEESKSLGSLFRGLSRAQWFTMGVLALANLCSTTMFSCIVPFFPTEARRKGLSTPEVGLIIGAFQLVSFLASPVLGRFMTPLGPNRLFSTGLLISGLSATAFGLLKSLPSGRPFFWCALVVRLVKAFGNACFQTSSLAIVARDFQGRVASAMGIMETFVGIGYTSGPLLGSALYELGGFGLPFFVLGSLMLASAVVSVLLFNLCVEGRRRKEGKEAAKISAAERAEDRDGGRTLELLRIPELWLTLSAMVVLEVSCFFYDASLAEHLSEFSQSAMLVGLMISLVSAFYLLSAPFCGLFVDRYPRCCPAVMLGGSLLAALAVLLMGPSPLLHLPKSVVPICISFALLGLSISALFIPTFQNCIIAARDRGFSDKSTHTCGFISGLLQGSAALGAFLGATLGGASVAQIGFAWTATLVSALLLSWASVQVLFLTCKRHFPSHSTFSHSSSSQVDSSRAANPAA